MALILVLALLVLFAALALAIFLTSKTERQASALFADTIGARQLADTSVNLCIAQIRDATSATNRAWISQPGLIRTFTGNRVAAENYRLYSWSPLRSSGSFDPLDAANTVTNNWAANKALYVDLNEPAPDPDDPTNTSKDKYPILYPPGLVGGNITGFGVTANNVGANATALPMPVQWLYVLQDGTVQTASANGTDSVIVSNATRTNPIVGRIAFWADDESSKVNLNTAAGGFPWMPPWVQNRTEYDRGGVDPIQTIPKPWGNIYGFGYAQPQKNEFQRYPGHPATTDLQAVFPELSWRDIYQLTPRVIEGGSENGINRTRKLAADNATPIDLILDRDRLLAGMGENRFAMSDAPRASLASKFPDTHLSNSDWDQLLEKRKGFLSVTSKAPELNLFGQPRVAVWPVPEFDTAPGGLPYRTAIDTLIAFCSTLTTNGTTRIPFFFDRRTGGQSNSSSVPKNTSLSQDDDIHRTRNTEIFKYLQGLTNKAFPGASSAAFSAKYGGTHGRDQILTEIFDYIRTTNIQDKQLNVDRQFNKWAYAVPTRWDAGNGEVSGFGRAFTIRQIGFLFICNADGNRAYGANGSVTPAIESNRAPGETETAWRNLYVPPVSANKTTSVNNALDTNTPLNDNQRRVQALLILELFSPSCGFKSFQTDSSSNFSFRIRGMENLTLNSNPLFPVESPPPFVPLGNNGGVDIASVTDGFGSTGGAINFRWPYMKRDVRQLINKSNPTAWQASSYSFFPYISFPVTITLNGNNTMEFSGGSLAVEILSGYDGSGNPQTLLEEINVVLSGVTLPVPQLADSKNYWAFDKSGIFGSGNSTQPGGVGRFAGYNGIIKSGSLEDQTSGNYASPSSGNYSLIADHSGHTPYDVIQTYILSHGDSRALFAPDRSANQDWVPVPVPTASVPTPAGLNPPRGNMRHFLSDDGPAGGVFGYTTGTSLAPEANLRWPGIAMPALLRKSVWPSGLNAPWTYGDWDMGSPLVTTDGPLINKPDEGSAYETPNVANPFAVKNTDAEMNAVASLYHSANRQIPSAVMFGSLPTGLISGQPWQTLLFRPDPGGHPGAVNPPDHLLLDLFWMPVVEPYAISEPFATAGKVNMNYQMIPFTYIERSTALRAALKGTQIGAIPEDLPTGRGFTKLYNSAAPWDPQFNFDINPDETLKSFQSRFVDATKERVFITPSEITTLPLVPAGSTLAGISTFWNTHRLTGENIKERPYATLYPRLTTKSNVFNIHYYVQTLRKKPGSDPTVWDETQDVTVARLRGNTIIERYIDMNRSDIPDYALPANANKSAESLYRFRILSNQEFSP